MFKFREFINTQLLQAVLRDPAWAGKLTEEGRRGLSPLFWSHINPYGRFRLDMETRPIQQMRLELETVYCTISRGETMLKFPVTMLILPTGSSPIRN